MQRLIEIDLGAHFFFQAQHRPWLDRIAVPLTHLGATEGGWHTLPIAPPPAAALFVALKRPMTACAVLLSLALGMALTEGTKRLVRRDRPDIPYLMERSKSPSFPSGHALISTATYGAIGLGLSR